MHYSDRPTKLCVADDDLDVDVDAVHADDDADVDVDMRTNERNYRLRLKFEKKIEKVSRKKVTRIKSFSQTRSKKNLKKEI